MLLAVVVVVAVVGGARVGVVDVAGVGFGVCGSAVVAVTAYASGVAVVDPHSPYRMGSSSSWVVDCVVGALVSSRPWGQTAFAYAGQPFGRVHMGGQALCLLFF